MNSVFTDNIKFYDNKDQQHYYDSFKGLTPTENLIVQQFFPKGNLRLLDMGCGAARTTIEFSRMGYGVTGIDLSESLLQKARTLYPELDLQYMDATKTIFEDQSFDIIVFSFNGVDCIYPATLRASVFDEVYRLLKPGGVFYYTGHSTAGFITRESGSGKKGIKNIIHFLKNQKSIMKCLKGYWNYKEGPSDNIVYAKSAKANVKDFNPSKWKLKQVIGSPRFGQPENKILFDGTTWLRPNNTAHNHFVLQKNG
jgi:SAM-dependent methyltransferase